MTFQRNNGAISSLERWDHTGRFLIDIKSKRRLSPVDNLSLVYEYLANNTGAGANGGFSMIVTYVFRTLWLLP